jgi:PII-like signaling protein
MKEGDMDDVMEPTLLRIFVGEADRYEGAPLFQAIVNMLMREGLGGATVVRGIEGFGASARMHAAHVLRLSDDLPIVIECVDGKDRIDAILPMLDAMIEGGLVTTEEVHVRIHKRPST